MVLDGVGDALQELLERRWWLIALRGLAGIIFGIICFASPAVAGLSLVLLFAVFSVVDGAFGLGAAVGQARQGARWVWLAVEAVASIVIGVLMLTMPGFALTFLFIFIAVKALLGGILLMLAALKLDAAHGRGLLLGAGLISLLFGIVLILAPLTGAKILIWWIGAWSLLFGVLLVGLGFKLRGVAKRLAVRGA
jgi:uncharacterized membrane protein HdeD (DUF308 family)